MTAPVLMSNLAPCQGQVTSAPSTVPSDSGPPRWVHVSLSAWNASPTRKRAIFSPSTSTSLACWSSNSSVVATFMNLGIALLPLGRFSLRSLLPSAASPRVRQASLLRRARLDPGVVDEELLVQRDEVFRLFRRLVLDEDRLHRAHRLAGPAVDTLVGVDEELVRPLIDAVHRADLDAGLVLDVDARLDDHVRHGDLPSSAPPLSSGVDDSVLEFARRPRASRLRAAASRLTPNRRRMTCASFDGKAATARSTRAASSLVWASSSGERAWMG